MSREKQTVEEMAKVIGESLLSVLGVRLNDDILVRLAEHPYEAGYRKQSEGEWVKVPRIISYTDDNVEVRTMCSHCGAEFVEHIPCDTYDYCPICGAKMKGGAE